MKAVKLAELTWPEARALGDNPRSVILLPLGAIEQHGPHLPLAVDWLGSDEIARRVASLLSRRGWQPILAPSVPYGVSPLAEDWCGTVSLRSATLRALILDTVQSLARHGFHRFVLASYQADPGHLEALAQAKRRCEKACRVQILYAGFSMDPAVAARWGDPRAQAMMRSPRPSEEWHSGEIETAVMLDLAPRLVRKNIARKLRPNWVDFRRALAKGQTFREMDPTGQGYFGSPAVARASTARRVLALRCRLVADYLLSQLQSWKRLARRPMTLSRGRPFSR